MALEKTFAIMALNDIKQKFSKYTPRRKYTRSCWWSVSAPGALTAIGLIFSHPRIVFLGITGQGGHIAEKLRNQGIGRRQ